MLSLCILSTILTIIHGNIVTEGKIQPFLNQTSVGVYRFKGWAREGLSFHSYWYQDDVNQNLALGIGKRGKDLQAHFWFFKTNGYELKPVDFKDQSKGYKCVEFVDFNYTMEVGGYDHHYLQSIGRMTVHEEKENFTGEFFLGSALDAVGPLSVMCVTDISDGTYAKMYTIQNIGGASYSEYYLHPRNDSVPPASYFELPPECKDPNNPPHKEYFFKKFNKKGERIDKEEKKEKCNNGVPVKATFILAMMIGMFVSFMLN